MKLLSLLSLAVTAVGIALLESGAVTEVDSTQGFTGHCGVHLIWNQVCNHLAPSNCVRITQFTDPSGNIINNAGWGNGNGQCIGENGADRWTLKGVMDSPFVVREYESRQHLQVEYQGCRIDTGVPSNGCGECNKLDGWSEHWSLNSSWGKPYGYKRTLNVDCWFN